VIRFLVGGILAGLAGVPIAAAAEPACPGRPEALGTFRELAVDPTVTLRVGRKHFPGTLALADKEVVLTFDDGPWPGTTTAVLDALERECVRATFFLLGRNAAAHPELARRELAGGHTVAHHSFHHPLLDRMSVAAAMAEIDHGFTAVDTALYGPRPGRTRLFSAFPDLHRRRRCSMGWPRAASRCSAPTCGRAIGTG
jgi:peptidoglycan-N-acetylglucosamine deacetylase